VPPYHGLFAVLMKYMRQAHIAAPRRGTARTRSRDGWREIPAELISSIFKGSLPFPE
jgi:hypothetical protein